VAAFSYQTEVVWILDGKSESYQDYFYRMPDKIEKGENADVHADFYQSIPTI
jgi:hypothetical protein